MASSALTREEGWGLAISIAAHAAIIAVLLTRPTPEIVYKPPERVEVTISPDVGLTSTSPDPMAQAAPDAAPDIGEPAPQTDAPSEPEIAPAPSPLPPAPAPRDIAPPKPQPKPEPKQVIVRRPEPKPVEAKKPEPKKQVAKPVPAPTKSPPKPSAIDRIAKSSSPSSKPATKSASSAASASKAPTKAATPPKKAGGSSFDEAFKSGSPGAKSATGTGAPAAAIGPQVRSSLASAIRRQLKPHWSVPQGAETELLVTKVRFSLNRDGSLAGEPRVISTTGQTAANEAQVSRHQEQAVRAVKLAAPFNLPEEYFSGWQTITTNFDRGLSQ